MLTNTVKYYGLIKYIYKKRICRPGWEGRTTGEREAVDTGTSLTNVKMNRPTRPEMVRL